MDTAVEYAAQAASLLINGEVKMTVSDGFLNIAALFDAAAIPFADINALIYNDYAVTVKTDGGDYSFSNMGQWCGPFYDALCAAYNQAVLRSLFINGDPIATANGDYSHSEGDAALNGAAPMLVYDNCVVSLPPDLNARRVPLCFVNGMEKADFQLTLKLDTGESYSYAKLGYDTSPFAETIERQIRALREKALSMAMTVDPSLAVPQASRIAGLMPLGAAIPIGRLFDISPSFVAALELELAKTRAAESYAAFKEICDPKMICVGLRKNEAADSTETPPPEPYLFWLIAPYKDGEFAIVEFAEADAATFAYRTGGDFNNFSRQLNHALEAISFKREVIRLSDEELLKPENTDYRMAAKRTAALQFVRANFIGRAIHSGLESWKSKLLGLME